MQNKVRHIFFIGSFLSSSRGTKGPGEFISHNFALAGYNVSICSAYKNKFIRLLDIIIKTALKGYSIAHIDVFSGKGFMVSNIAASIVKFRGKKYVLTLHGGRLPEFEKEGNNSDKIRKLFSGAYKITTPSLYLKEYFEKQEYSIEYIPNFIDTQNFKYKRDAVIPHSILWVRGFGAIYNPGLAIDAFALVKKKFPDAILTMVGPDGGLLEECRKKIATLNLSDNIKITGPIKNIELHRLYQNHEVYINTTSYESFGVSVVEAASCGVPVVSTAVGEIPYLWKEDEDIVLVHDFKPESLAEKVISLFENKEKAKSISNKANAKVQQYTWENIFPKWKAVFGLQ